LCSMDSVSLCSCCNKATRQSKFLHGLKYDEGKTNSESQSMPWSKDDLPSELQAADGACRFLETSASLAGLGHA
jgi:hypothetical protein